MSKQSQAFNDIMVKSTAEFGMAHLYAHEHFTRTMAGYTGIDQYGLSDREKALVAYAIYIGLSMGEKFHWGSYE